MPHRWEMLLRDLVDRATSEPMTQGDLEIELQRLVDRSDSPVSGVQFEFPPARDGALTKVGPAGQGEESEKSSLELTSTVGGSVLIWRGSQDQALRRQVTDGLVELGSAVFAGRWRDEKAGLISTHVPGVSSLVERAVQRMVEVHGGASVIYADLDHFKEVNDREDHEAGDRVIREVAEVLELAASPNALAIHTGGDEFVVLCPGHVEDGLELGRQIADAFKNQQFSTEIDIGITMGLRPVADGFAIPAFDTLVRDAESATKEIGESGEHDGEKRRGRLSIATEPSSPEVSLELGAQLDRAKVVVKSMVDHPRPFQDAWLNVVSQLAMATAESIGADQLSEPMKDLAEWINPNWSSGCAAAARLSSTQEIPTCSKLDLCMAVAHGLLRAALLNPDGPIEPLGQALEIHYSEQGGAQLRMGNTLLVDFGAGDSVYNLGGFVLPEDSIEHEQLDARPAILVNIGEQLPEALAPVFYEAITVDDRPTAGGGLPDFWEATVARVVAAANRSPNVDFLAIVGTQEHGSHTIEQLTGMADWTGDRAWELSERTATDPRDITAAGQRLKDGYHVCPDPDDLLAKLADHLTVERTVQPVGPPPDTPGPIVIQRDWTAIDLDRQDGFRVSTLAEAFPLVLQVLGQTLDREDFQIVDAAGIKMVDLRDVKIVFREPFQDEIPAFYRDREQSFTDYFESHFVNADGRFASAITSEQYERVVAHVVHAITRDDPFSTRRANIVLPHDLTVQEPPDLSPLGLISLRCIPRFSGDEIVLHFSFTWRTVEALVGFPYSAYGSVNYARRIADDICSRLVDSGRSDVATRIRIADISYIAHSLHMATDAYGRKIAHQIIAG